MADEAHDILPAAQKHFIAAGWAALEAVFAASRDPLTSHRPAEGDRPLFQKIVAHAPWPIGLARRARLQLEGLAYTSAAMQPKAIILAAGRGERMRPLTDRTPKPLLRVRGKALIEWHLEALARAGVRDVVVNTAWLEEQFPTALGDGARYGVRIHWSHEGRDHGGALETAGGVAKALPLLGPVFWAVSGDVFLPGFEFDPAAHQDFAAGDRLAQLWMVDNPPHHPQGDFGIDEAGLAVRDTARRHTWASVGLFRAELFQGVAAGTRMPLRPLLEKALDARRLGVQRWGGRWIDVGTAERLAAANADPQPASFDAS